MLYRPKRDKRRSWIVPEAAQTCPRFAHIRYNTLSLLPIYVYWDLRRFSDIISLPVLYSSPSRHSHYIRSTLSELFVLHAIVFVTLEVTLPPLKYTYIVCNIIIRHTYLYILKFTEKFRKLYSNKKKPLFNDTIILYKWHKFVREKCLEGH